MIDKSMPEYIFAEPKSKAEINPYGRWEENVPTGFLSMPTIYIRADLGYKSSANEPLVHGQYRWVKHYDWPCWEMGKIIQQNIESDAIEVELENLIVDVDCLEKIGPVIHPPE